MKAAEIGNVEDKPALHDALERGVNSVSVEADSRGTATYELYIPYRRRRAHRDRIRSA